VRFLVDMPLSPALATSLRDQGHDAIHATESNLDRASDNEVLARARREGRTIITADLDYPRLLALARADNPSLILFRDGNWSDADVIRRMSEILQAISASEIAQSIIVVDRERVRRRKLPIEP
jgi:predicted nuclease of predicted toxin-antitoxin system